MPYILWSTCDTEGDWHERALQKNSEKWRPKTVIQSLTDYRRFFLNYFIWEETDWFQDKVFVLLLVQDVFCVQTNVKKNISKLFDEYLDVGVS